jgi:hypothetical protein
MTLKSRPPGNVSTNASNSGLMTYREDQLFGTEATLMIDILEESKSVAVLHWRSLKDEGFQ